MPYFKGLSMPHIQSKILKWYLSCLRKGSSMCPQQAQQVQQIQPALMPKHPCCLFLELLGGFLHYADYRQVLRADAFALAASDAV